MKERSKKYSKGKMWTKVLFEFSGSWVPWGEKGLEEVQELRTMAWQPWWRPGTPFGYWAWLCFAPHTSFPGELFHCILSLSRCHWPTALSSLSSSSSLRTVCVFLGACIALLTADSLFLSCFQPLEMWRSDWAAQYHPVESHHSV